MENNLKEIFIGIKSSINNAKSKFETFAVQDKDARKFELTKIELSKVIDMCDHFINGCTKIDNDDLDNFLNIFGNALHMLNDFVTRK